MLRPRLIPAALLAFAAAVAIAGDAAGTWDQGLAAEVTARRLTKAVEAVSRLSRPAAADQYLGGFALMELHRPDEAEPRLRAAKDAGFSAWKGWPGVDELLGRAATVRELLPPLHGQCGAIAVHAGRRTAWSAPVLAAMPEFDLVGRSIFGVDLPRVRFSLFADRKSYDRFYGALFGTSVATSWQDGTGTTNVVVCCETDRNGKSTRDAGAPETISCVLHEFGHAWFGTYVMDKYGREWLIRSGVRPWLDEGLADYVASLREPAFLDRRAAWLRAWVARKAARPEFADLAEYAGFYEKGDPCVHYWTSALLVAELVGDRKSAPETIRRLLDEIGRTGDPDASVKSVTGKDPRKVFEEIVRLYWR